MRYTSIFLLLLVSVITCAKETITFDIFLFGDKIGTMFITREIKSDSSELYILESKSKAKFLWINKENESRYEVVYKYGKLISSRFIETENGETKRWTNVKWDGSKYWVDSYKGKRNFTEAPVYSVVSVYFNDISKVKRIFYEAEADFNDLKRSDEANTWEFKSSDGNRNVYHFKSGKINAMEFHVSIATIKMIRTN